ncbi:NAD(P)-dependent oxidoreductase (plasmid) [Rhizobium leguminosarum]
MSYNETSLYASAALLESCVASTRTDLLIMQHIVPNTVNFVQLLLRNGFHIAAFIAKPLSVHEPSFQRLVDLGLRVIRKDYDALESDEFLDDLIAEAAEEARRRGHKLTIIDVGGYMRVALSRLREKDRGTINGVVEVTTFGHNNYTKWLPHLMAPVVSLARSPLKMAEAILVGDSAVVATDIILRKAGLMLQARSAGMIGFGAIGEPTAQAARAKGMRVIIHDTDPLKLALARLLGFEVAADKGHLLRNVDLVFASTGSRSVELSDLTGAKDGITIISVGSKGNEYDISGLADISVSKKELGEELVEYRLANGKTIHVIRGGKAVNFYIQSCPDEAMDLVFAEQIACVEFLLGQQPLAVLHELPAEVHRKIAQAWLSGPKLDILAA